jgi:hypothetical protein
MFSRSSRFFSFALIIFLGVGFLGAAVCFADVHSCCPEKKSDCDMESQDISQSTRLKALEVDLPVTDLVSTGDYFIVSDSSFFSIIEDLTVSSFSHISKTGHPTNAPPQA